MDGAGESELLIMNKRISLLRIPVCSNYTNIYFSNSLLRLTLIPNCSAMRVIIIIDIMTEFLQVLTHKRGTVVGVETRFSKSIGLFFDCLLRFFFWIILASVSIVVANRTEIGAMGVVLVTSLSEMIKQCYTYVVGSC